MILGEKSSIRVGSTICGSLWQSVIPAVLHASLMPLLIYRAIQLLLDSQSCRVNQNTFVWKAGGNCTGGVDDLSGCEVRGKLLYYREVGISN